MSGISRTELQAIRAKLSLRYNMAFSCYEVYTTIHGSGVFRWYKITDEIADWYKNHFDLTVTQYLQPSISTGGLIEQSFRQ